MIKPKLFSLVTGARAASAAALVACALAVSAVIAAQAGPTLTFMILDGKTGEPLHPSNYLVRIDHRDEPYNETLKLNDDGTATVVLPPGAASISIQGSYDASTQFYVNCDVDTAREGGTPKWYAIADIVKSGMVTPDLCYKGKYEHRYAIAPKPGQFVFFVRTISWHDGVY